MGAPNLTFSFDKSAIGANQYVTVSFTSDVPYTQFEARATLDGTEWGRGVGTLVGAFSATPANTERTFEVYDTEIVNGDGVYRISLFAQGLEGAWNDNVQFIDYTGNWFITSDGKNYLSMK